MTGKDSTALVNFLKELGPSVSVEKWLQGYGNPRTRTSYAGHLCLYTRWLKTEKRIRMSPDEMVRDNLRAVFESGPTDVTSKRKHTDLMGEYINKYMVAKGSADITRKVALSAIVTFYRGNDSSLFGSWRFADQPPTKRPPALHAEDIRKVLLTMPIWARTPLLISWQSSIEIGRVLEICR
jgi:hypothetical protein